MFISVSGITEELLLKSYLSEMNVSFGMIPWKQELKLDTKYPVYNSDGILKPAGEVREHVPQELLSTQIVFELVVYFVLINNV
jgi:hypothetical protein